MLARIRMGRRMINPLSNPTIIFNSVPGKVILNITIELPLVDPQNIPPQERTLSIVDDSDRTQDPVIKQRFRDALVGADMVEGVATRVRAIQITSPNPADGASTLTITADLGTKLPGTGWDVKSLMEEHEAALKLMQEEREANLKLMQEQPDLQYENGKEILST